jgi:hypothetical protein
LVDLKKTSILESILQLVLKGKKSPKFWLTSAKKKLESMLQLVLKEKISQLGAYVQIFGSPLISAIQNRGYLKNYFDHD